MFWDESDGAGIVQAIGPLGLAGAAGAARMCQRFLIVTDQGFVAVVLRQGAFEAGDPGMVVLGNLTPRNYDSQGMFHAYKSSKLKGLLLIVKLWGFRCREVAVLHPFVT
jgi:hypothetical protein